MNEKNSINLIITIGQKEISGFLEDSNICIERNPNPNPKQLDLFGDIYAAGMSFEDLMQKVNK